MNMMKKMWIGMALAGIVTGQTALAASQVDRVLTGAEKAIGAAAYAAYMAQAIGSMQWPVVDITSIPTHAVVAFEQDFNNFKTYMETDAKNEVRDLITGEGKSESSPMLGTRRMIGQKMSEVKLNTDKVQTLVGKGLADAKAVAEAGKKTTQFLTAEQQNKYASASGTLTGKGLYQEARTYAEQEQAIQTLAQAVVIRKNVAEKVPAVVADIRSQYQDSVGGDLKSASGNVGTNENAAWRQYALQGLAYDQLLSLEQQVLGFRLKAKGGAYEQKLTPVRDKLNVKG